MFLSKSARKKPAACGNDEKMSIDEEDDPDLQEVMDIARALAASNGESSFMQGIAVGDAKDAYLESRAAIAPDQNADSRAECIEMEDVARIM